VGWGGGEGAVRTIEVQRGKGRVLLERGGHRRDPIITDAVVCNTRGLRDCVQARVARAQVVRGTPNHHMCIGVAVWRGEKCRGTHIRGPAW
jgi:trehalose utilization protein